MRWQLKAAAHAVLSVAPGGARVHRRLQEAAGTVGPHDVLVELERKSHFLRRLDDHGISLQDATVLEIGTGWHPVLPVLLSMRGARRTITIDLRSWLTERTLLETADGLERVAELLPEDAGVPAETGRETAAGLRAALAAGASPQEALLQIGIEARWPVDAAATGLPADACDLVVSSNVLEHVPPDELDAMAAEWTRILRPGGATAHHVDPGDHFTDDRRITSVNFLKFSPRAWRVIGSGLAYHNRLRCADYPPVLERVGFDVVGVEVETDAAALGALREGGVRPHASFARYTDVELAGTLVDVFARSPERPARGLTGLA